MKSFRPGSVITNGRVGQAGIRSARMGSAEGDGVFDAALSGLNTSIDILPECIIASATLPRSSRATPKTVDTYKQRINEKLGLAHRSDYVDFALKIGLLAD